MKKKIIFKEKRISPSSGKERQREQFRKAMARSGHIKFMNGGEEKIQFFYFFFLLHETRESFFSSPCRL